MDTQSAGAGLADKRLTDENILILAGLFSSGGCRWLLGPTLGTLFVQIVLIAVLAPLCPMKTHRRLLPRRWPTRLPCGVRGVIGPSVAISLFSIGLGPWTSVLQWFALCIGWAALMAMIGNRGIGRTASELSRCIAWTFGFAWLAWPILLAASWTDARYAPLLDWLTDYHPLLVANGLFPNLGDWTHRPIAYQYLLNLGQSVPYGLPTSAWPLILADAAAVGIWVCFRHLWCNDWQPESSVGV